MLQSQLSKTLVGCYGPSMFTGVLNTFNPTCKNAKIHKHAPPRIFGTSPLNPKDAQGKRPWQHVNPSTGLSTKLFAIYSPQWEVGSTLFLTQRWGKSRRQILRRKRLPNMSLDEDKIHWKSSKCKQIHMTKCYKTAISNKKTHHAHGFTAIMHVHVSNLFEAISCHAFLWRAPTRQNWASKSSPCRLRIKPTFLGQSCLSYEFLK